jgi:hypothetical protein
MTSYPMTRHSEAQADCAASVSAARMGLGEMTGHSPEPLHLGDALAPGPNLAKACWQQSRSWIL